MDPVTTSAAPASVAAPAAATAATSSPAPASTGVNTPHTVPATTRQVDGQGGAGALSPDDSVNAMLAAFDGKPTPVVADKTTTSDGVVDPAAAVEPPAAAEGDGIVPAAAGEGEEEEGYNFDEDGFTGAKDLATKLDGIENLDPELRNELLANARIAESLAPYRELFGSPEEAKVVAQAANEYSQAQSVFQSITPENVQQGTSDFLNLLLQMSALKDENGQPRRRENGTYITDGTTTRLLNELFDRKFNTSIVKKIEDSGDAAAIAALDVVMERAGLRASTADNTNVDPTIAAERAKLEADRKQFNEQQDAGRKAAVKSYNDRLNGELNTLSSGAFDKLLKSATGLDGLTKTAVITKLSKAVTSAIKADPSYQIEKRALQSQPMTEARLQKEKALANRWMNSSKFLRLAKPILSEAGITVSKKAAESKERQTARAEAARGDVGGSAPVAKPSAANMTPQQAWNATAKALEQKLGRTPSDSEVNIEMMLSNPKLKGRAA